MSFQTLIDVNELLPHLNDPSWVLLDCRFSLANPSQGRQHYETAHLPNAHYVHLDEDLSSEVIPGQTSRHPLPKPDDFAKKLSHWGIDASKQVVVYDDGNGAFAARCWWMLRWLGHANVAVLNGGWKQWTHTESPTSSEMPSPTTANFIPEAPISQLWTAEEVHAKLDSSTLCLLDARAKERYLGNTEPLDPIAGHIPGATCATFTDNLNDNQTLKSKDALQARFQELTQGVSGPNVVCYCGSGVTACHNVLAMVHAGLDEPGMYAGSWSEWITDTTRPFSQPSQS